MKDFVALDFETADNGRDSACAIGLVRVSGGEIVKRTYYLIKPPRSRIIFSHIHGIYWRDVAYEPTFAELWPTLAQEFADVDFIAAHNAPFDRGVLAACCLAADVAMPVAPFRCTVQLARKVWEIRPTKLSDVCHHLNIPLNHHHAGSDAEACARIVIAAQQKLILP
jgi:DNA polymerase-3 subunit epsilon